MTTIHRLLIRLDSYNKGLVRFSVAHGFEVPSLMVIVRRASYLKAHAKRNGYDRAFKDYSRSERLGYALCGFASTYLERYVFDRCRYTN